MKVYKLVTALHVSKGLNTFTLKNILMFRSINFSRKGSYGTNSKQGDNLYDSENTCKGINDSLPNPHGHLQAYDSGAL